jgi:trans-aconitate 2-methyltransferase
VTEWNAASYHKVSGPQTAWGQKVLARLSVTGDERAIDAGCGSGRLTGELLERLPRGRLVFIDRVTALSAREDPPFTLDHWRLNLNARRLL